MSDPLFSKDGERPRCERGGNGNVFVVQPHEDPDDLTSMKLIQKFKYGDIRSDRDLDEVGSIYSFILVLHKKTAVVFSNTGMFSSVKVLFF
nr:unnamed protein product [Haemonchus contortus]